MRCGGATSRLNRACFWFCGVKVRRSPRASPPLHTSDTHFLMGLSMQLDYLTKQLEKQRSRDAAMAASRPEARCV